MNRYRLKKAFTIAEALIILLAVSLLAVAVVPALTKKHVKIGTHGKWICTVDNSGNHYVATEYKGKMSDFVYVGKSCSFTPPANAQNISIKAVGGGGSGARGEAGNEELLFQSNSKGEVFVKSIPNDGYYYVTAVGGGGAGGGIGCGEFKEHYKDPNTLFGEDGYLNGVTYYKEYSISPKSNDWTWDVNTQSTSNDDGSDVVNATPSGIVYPTSIANKKYTYGYVYKAYPGYNYKALVKNDNRYSEVKDETKIQWLNPSLQWQSAVPIDEFKYKHLPTDLQREYQVCFPTESVSSVWPFAKKYDFLGKAVEGMYVKNPTGNKNAICWNLPSQGGRAGNSISKNVYINGGENIVVTTGRGGKGLKGEDTKTVKDHDGKTYTAPVGKQGENGSDTLVTVGANHFTASGGLGGYGRYLKKSFSFVNIPLQICEIQKTTASFDDNPRCSSYDMGYSTTENKTYADSMKSSCDSTPGCKSYMNSYTNERVKSCSGGGYCYLYTWSKSACESTTYKEKTTDADGNEVEVEKNCVANMETYYKYNTECWSGKHQGPKYVIGSCDNVIRSTYFEGKISACASTLPTTVGNVDDEVVADKPGIFGEFEETRRIWSDPEMDKDLGLPEVNMIASKLDYGSGGYGIGVTSASYLAVVNTGYNFIKAMRFHGYDGQDGYAEVKRVSYSSGGGGQAGQYISTNLRKTGKLSVTVGKGGVGGGDNRSGNNGGNTIIKDQNGKILFNMMGGKGGIAPASRAEMSVGKMMGVDGALSPFESPYNKARLVPYGGFSGNNASPNGISPSTPKWLGTGNKYGSYLLTTYGAGGGGGGASKTEAGGGGNGAPGAVIIEW